MGSVKAILKGFPLAAVGILLCFTFWLTPLGLLLIHLGCRPFYKLQAALLEADSVNVRVGADKYEDEPIPEWVGTLEPNNVVSIDKNKKE